MATRERCELHNKYLPCAECAQQLKINGAESGDKVAAAQDAAQDLPELKPGESAEQTTGDAQQPQPKGPVVRAALSITLYEDGNFQCQGPLDDPLIFHGLLGLAADALQEYQQAARANARRIDTQAAKKGPNFLKRVLGQLRTQQGILKP